MSELIRQDRQEVEDIFCLLSKGRQRAVRVFAPKCQSTTQKRRGGRMGRGLFEEFRRTCQKPSTQTLQTALDPSKPRDLRVLTSPYEGI